jgi:hypothetical protein
MPGNFSLNPVASVLNVQKAPMLMIPADVRGEPGGYYIDWCRVLNDVVKLQLSGPIQRPHWGWAGLAACSEFSTVRVVAEDVVLGGVEVGLLDEHRREVVAEVLPVRQLPAATQHTCMLH